MWMPQVVAGGVRVGTMWTVGGRVREGNPPNFGLTWALWFKTPATGAVDFSAYGSCRPPLVIWDLRS